MIAGTVPLADDLATGRLGAAVGAMLRPGDAILLDGPLGAGKSSLARALVRAAVGDPALEVPSPTFTLVQHYAAGALRIAHFDLWRLQGPEALHELGWDEARSGVVIVEWPDRLGPYAPADALRIALSPDGRGRRASLSGWDRRGGAA